MAESSGGRIGRRFLALVAIVEISAALYALLLGGFHFTVGPLRVSSGDPARPFAIGIVCACLATWLRDRVAIRPSWHAIASWSSAVAASAAVATFMAGVSFGAFAAGGSDQYGYVSQAFSWASGNLFVKEPLVTIDPLLTPAAVPLGYQLAGRDTIVSIYSPGLPMMMAPALLLGGEQAVYFVVPLLGALAVWLTYSLGRRVADPRAGLVAAIAVACSPIFLLQLFLPMGDVPSTALWLAAIVAALSNMASAPLFAGVVSSLAVVTRPNLVPLALVVAAMVMMRRRRATALFMFAFGLLPGCTAIALLYRTLYGSAIQSGYGALDTLFRWEWVGTNLRRYPQWLVQTHSFGILLGFAAPFFRRSAVTLLLLGYCLLVVGCYAFYMPFDGWQFVRFLLPAVPVLLVLSAMVALALVEQLPSTTRGACVIALSGLLAGAYIARAHELGVFYVRDDQRRFLSIGRYLGHALPGNAIVFAGLHSGSMRLYGQRPTLRWTQLGPQDLDRTVTLMTAKGFAYYVLVEAEEERQFREWFASSNQLGKLDWAPSYEYVAHPGAKVYAFAARRRLPDGALRPPAVIPPQ